MTENELTELQTQVQDWAYELGFQQVGFSDTDLSNYVPRYRDWLAHNFHGDMGYMARNIAKRIDPKKLVPSTIGIVSLRMDYLHHAHSTIPTDSNLAVVSRYAQGRDYHKLIRRRIAELGNRINSVVEGNFRAFVDSAPVLEKPIAEKAGLGWTGKNTLILNENAGSYFFLGELFTNIPFKTNPTPSEDQCGKCQACINICPTQAIVAPRQLDSRKCISYLTIEHKGTIPIELRKQIGNRVFGCDDCQIICPWNRYASISLEADFTPRHGLDQASIVELLYWSEGDFLEKTRGMAIRRINFSQWVRNLAVAAGNADSSPELLTALKLRYEDAESTGDALALEHLDWALGQLNSQVA